MKNNKNGFTLIELLVTIALMISILAIAIISITKVNDRFKERSFESVKDEVITAAKEYFNVNSYYLESLGVNGAKVKVSIGELVNNDYLNKVTDPRTGKKLNYCDYVLVSRGKNKKNKYEFVSDESTNTSECSTHSYVEVTEANGPEIEISANGTPATEGSGWDYKMDENYEAMKYLIEANKVAEKDIPPKGAIIKITARDDAYGMSIGDILMRNSDNNDFSFISSELEGNELVAYDKSTYSMTTPKDGTTMCYKAVNNAGYSTTGCITLKVDVDQPTCIIPVIGVADGTGIIPIQGNNYTYYKYKSYGLTDLLAFKPIINLTYSDEDSGVSSKTLCNGYADSTSCFTTTIPSSQSANEKVVKYVGNIIDKAGNRGSCKKYISVSRDKTIVENLTDELRNKKIYYCGNTEGESTKWTNKDRTIKQYFNYYTFKDGEKDNSSYKSKTYQTSTKTDKIQSDDDKSLTCEVNVYVDKEKPKLSSIKFNKVVNGVNYIHFKQYNATFNYEVDLPVTKINDNLYQANACLVNEGKGQKFNFNFSGYSVSASDPGGSGINSNSWQWPGTSYSETQKKWTSKECNASEKQNPCWVYLDTYVYDNAGNKSENLVRIQVHVGYKGMDSFCK